MSERAHPIMIQGGMRTAISSWQLAKAVALTGQLGVVSGTALDVVLVRRLQLEDPSGHLRRVLAEFPLPEMAKRVLDRDFIPAGKPRDAPFVAHKLLDEAPSPEQLELIVVASSAEVYLAKEDHGLWRFRHATHRDIDAGASRHRTSIGLLRDNVSAC